MDHRLLGGSLAAVLMAATAGAASAQSAPGDWAGFYIGGGIGYTAAPGEADETLKFDTNLDGAFDNVVRGVGGRDIFIGYCSGAAYTQAIRDGCNGDNDSVTGSLRAGYDWQSGGFVFGGLIEGALMRINDSVSGYTSEPNSYAMSRNIDGFFALRGRLGWAAGPALLYATGGGAWAQIDHSFLTTNTVNTFSQSSSDDSWGYQLGAGIETKLSPSIALNIEYLFTSFDDGDNTIGVSGGTLLNPFRVGNPAGTNIQRSEDDFNLHNFGVNLIWRQ